MIISCQDAGIRSIKARMHFENMVCKQANHAIEQAADRGEYTAQFTITGIPMHEFHCRHVVGALNKAGYKASYTSTKDGIRVTVCWVPTIDDFPLLAALPVEEKKS